MLHETAFTYAVVQDKHINTIHAHILYWTYVCALYTRN